MREHVLARRADARRRRRRRRDGRRRRADVQHLDHGRDRRGGGGRRGREARKPRRQLGLGLRGRARGARASTSSSRRRRIAESIDTLGFGFMFAPLHHPAMRHAAPVRRELGTRTVFNVLGPLTNPAGARAGVFGVYSPDAGTDRGGRPRRARHPPRVRRPRRARASTSSRRRGRTSCSRSWTGAVREWVLDPLELGIDRASRRSSSAARPRRTRGRRARSSPGAGGAKRDAVVLNAAGAIAAGGPCGRPARGA